MIGRGFLKLSVDVRPTARQFDPRPIARTGFVGLERIANDDAVVMTHEIFESRRTLVVANAVADKSGSSDAPHLPGLAGLVFQTFPARLIESDHGLLERVLHQRGIIRFEPSRQRIELI